MIWVAYGTSAVKSRRWRQAARPVKLAAMAAGLAGALLTGTSFGARAQITGGDPRVNEPVAPSSVPPIGVPQPLQASPPQDVANQVAPPLANPRVSVAADFVPIDTGKGPRVGPYYLNRSEEDFSYLRDPTKHNDLFDALKFIRLNDAGTAYLTFSGEERLRMENFTKNSFSYSQPTHNEIIQLRSKYGADLHLNEYVRGYVEVINGALGGSGYGQPTPIQRSDLSLLQAFGEVSVPVGDAKIGARIGRQELWLGNGTLISTREGGNIPSTLDGFRGYYDDGKLRVDGFAFDNVNNHYGVLDDSTNAHQQYWGIYATQALPSFQLSGAQGRLFAEPFYIGNYTRRATFANVTGADARYMLGGRLWGQIGAFDVDAQGSYQGGKTGSADVSAYAVFANAGYTFDAPGSPRIGLRSTVVSGGQSGPTVRNAHTGNELNTFNPLLPAPTIFSESLLLAPINLIEVAPGVSFSPTSKLRVYAYTLFAWKYAERDGVYSSGFTQYRNTVTAPGRYIGFQPAIRASYSINQHILLSGALADFRIGPALKNAGDKNNAYALAQVTFKF